MPQISSTNNPYRFAQLYNDPFSPNKPCNRSQSTLGSPNQNYFSQQQASNNTLPYSNTGGPMLKSNSKSNLMEPTSNSLGHPYYQQQQNNNASTISYQSQAYQPASSLTSPYTESLLGMMNKEYNNTNHNHHNYSFKMQQQAAAAAAVAQQQQQQQQHYDTNIMGQNGKQSKTMFLQQQQQSFIAGGGAGGGGGRSKTGPVESNGNVFNHSNNLRSSGSYLPTNYNSNTGKVMKASKI